jgi:Amidohydrolase
MTRVTSLGFVVCGRVVDSQGHSMPSVRRGATPMIIDTHTHVVSSHKVKHPLDPGARGWSTEVSNNVEDLIVEMDRAGVDCATLVQPNGTYGLDNSYQCDSANQYAPRTIAVGILDPAAPDAADQLSYGVHERGMQGVRLQSQAEPDDARCAALWQRAAGLGIPLSLGGGGQPEKVHRMQNVGARHPGEFSLSRFAAGTHAGAAHGVPGVPPASAAVRPCP